LLRICLAPFLVSTILDGHYGLSFGLFIAAGLTDALDGTVARLLKQRTVLGQYLDPVADKILLSTLFLVLTHKGLIPARVTVLVFGRDVGILLVAAILYAAAGRREFTPSIFGKANTTAQVAAVAAVLLHQLTTVSWVVMFRTLALYATMVLTVPALRMGRSTACRQPASRGHRGKIGSHSFQLSFAASSGSTVSSISMSRNSSESKTSPHSRHSTYSVSSSRETIRTLGCLQTVAITRVIRLNFDALSARL
jgi:cardiolipin synthase